MKKYFVSGSDAELYPAEMRPESDAYDYVYLASDVEALESKAVDQALRIKELEAALRDIRAFLVKVNERGEIGNIDAQIVADIDCALMER